MDIDKGFEDFSGEGYTQVRCCAWQVSWGCVRKRSVLSRVLSVCTCRSPRRHTSSCGHTTSVWDRTVDERCSGSATGATRARWTLGWTRFILGTFPMCCLPFRSSRLGTVFCTCACVHVLSIVQVPGGIPVGTLAIGKAGAMNAGLLAASVLALSDIDLANRLDAWRAKQTESVALEPKDEA